LRQVVFVQKGRFEWREAPDPTLQGAREALVRPTIVGRCDLDVAFTQGRRSLPSGSPIGHEIIHDGTLAAWANCGFRADIVPTQRIAWDDAAEGWLSGALYVAAVRG
jgi:hypothetical protein